MYPISGSGKPVIYHKKYCIFTRGISSQKRRNIEVQTTLSLFCELGYLRKI
jgi:hypothetical protein